MIKNYILDTNVLLHDPRALFVFEDNRVIIPIHVIEEIDTFKKDNSELGRNAREVSRTLDALAEEGDVQKGVPNGLGGELRIAFTQRELPDEVATAGSTVDSRVIAVALDAGERDPEMPAVLVTKDTNLRLRARALGLAAADYEHDRTRIDELFLGYREVGVADATIDDLYAKGEVPLPTDDFDPNEFVHLSGGSPSHTALARVNRDAGCLKAVRPDKRGTWGLQPRNREQVFALELLMDPNVHLVTLVGKAGTGKTLIALAAGLEATAERNTYEKLLVSRPVMPLGKDIGFLPGTVDEKLQPWLKPVFDNLDFLMNLGAEERQNGRGSQEMFDMKLVEVEPLTYIRGRSLPRLYLIVDEAQNLTPHEAKTIVSRAGEGTKIVMTGDPDQVDNPYLDARGNGLVHVAKRFRTSALAGHVTLTQGERSPLAEEAANRL